MSYSLVGKDKHPKEAIHVELDELSENSPRSSEYNDVLSEASPPSSEQIDELSEASPRSSEQTNEDDEHSDVDSMLSSNMSRKLISNEWSSRRVIGILIFTAFAFFLLVVAIYLYVHFVSDSAPGADGELATFIVRQSTLITPRFDIPTLEFSTGPGASKLQEVDGVPVYRRRVNEPLNIRVHNTIGVSTSVHLHGQTPNAIFDGVPYLSSLPIEANEARTLTFPVDENAGTYFIHSHYDLQHSNGLAAALLVDGPTPPQYPLKSIMDSRRTREIVLFVRDICPYLEHDLREEGFRSET